MNAAVARDTTEYGAVFLLDEEVPAALSELLTLDFEDDPALTWFHQMWLRG